MREGPWCSKQNTNIRNIQQDRNPILVPSLALARCDLCSPGRGGHGEHGAHGTKGKREERSHRRPVGAAVVPDAQHPAEGPGQSQTSFPTITKPLQGPQVLSRTGGHRGPEKWDYVLPHHQSPAPLTPPRLQVRTEGAPCSPRRSRSRRQKQPPISHCCQWLRSLCLYSHCAALTAHISNQKHTCELFCPSVV